MKRILIYFGDEQQKQPIVEQVLKDMHADYRILQDADLNQCVANLMGLPDLMRYRMRSLLTTALTSCCLKMLRMRRFKR